MIGTKDRLKSPFYFSKGFRVAKSHHLSSLLFPPPSPVQSPDSLVGTSFSPRSHLSDFQGRRNGWMDNGWCLRLFYYQWRQSSTKHLPQIPIDENVLSRCGLESRNIYLKFPLAGTCYHTLAIDCPIAARGVMLQNICIGKRRERITVVHVLILIRNQRNFQSQLCCTTRNSLVITDWRRKSFRTKLWGG